MTPTILQQKPKEQNIITKDHMHFKGSKNMKYKKKHLEDKCFTVMEKMIAMYETHESFWDLQSDR